MKLLTLSAKNVSRQDDNLTSSEDVVADDSSVVDCSTSHHEVLTVSCQLFVIFVCFKLISMIVSFWYRIMTRHPLNVLLRTNLMKTQPTKILRRLIYWLQLVRDIFRMHKLICINGYDFLQSVSITLCCRSCIFSNERVVV